MVLQSVVDKIPKVENECGTTEKQGRAPRGIYTESRSIDAGKIVHGGHVRAP